MRALVLIIISPIIFFCSQDNININNKNIDFIEMNKRFDYENINYFKTSILIYVKENSIDLEESEINKIYDKKNNIIEITNVLKLGSHEEYIKKNPNEIYNLITISNHNFYKDKIIFESMQAYLRTVINTLK